jgi:hypothetical protein
MPAAKARAMIVADGIENFMTQLLDANMGASEPYVTRINHK